MKKLSKLGKYIEIPYLFYGKLLFIEVEFETDFVDLNLEEISENIEEIHTRGRSIVFHTGIGRRTIHVK